MTPERLAFALEHLPATDWALFEEVCSAFLASEFSGLRTTAWQSGDGGADARLFAFENEQNVLFQFSVTAGWQQKLRNTAETVKTNFPNATLIIYVTNRKLGPKADDVVSEIRSVHGIHLDIRDQRWLVDRQLHSPAIEAACERLALRVVEPILASASLSKTNTHLDLHISRAALIHLQLQYQDDAKEKSLTRVCFESLVRTTLIEATPEIPLARADVFQRVSEMLPHLDPDSVAKNTDAALRRLEKTKVRHHTKSDAFCLTAKERERLNDRVASLDAQADAVTLEAEAHLTRISRRDNVVALTEADLVELSGRVRRIIETLFFERGEWFAGVLQSNTQIVPADYDISSISAKDIAQQPLQSARTKRMTGALAEASAAVLSSGSADLRTYLRSLSDAYSLLAFLKRTPDVQKAVVQMFSHGELWLDTNVVIPLFAELLSASPNTAQYHLLMRAARDAGLHLHVTPGVVEEINKLFEKSLFFEDLPSHEWKGEIPFFSAAYIWSGKKHSSIGVWVEQFRGRARPESDITEFLLDEYGISTTSLEVEWTQAPTELKTASEIFWRDVMKKRRKDKEVLDAHAADRLVRHDAENFVGTIQRRTKEERSPFGHHTWWVTTDSAAFRAPQSLKAHGLDFPSPVMSPDFLSNTLSVGPCRTATYKNADSLPLFVDAAKTTDILPLEVAQLVTELRQGMVDLPERIIQRRIRDALDAMKSEFGEIAKGGHEELKKKLKLLLSRASVQDA